MQGDAASLRLGVSHWSWLAVFVGLAAMYVPIYWAAAHGSWQSDEYGHGPILLVIAAWLFWRIKPRLLDTPARPMPVLGWALLIAGLLLYTLGRILHVPSAEFLSQAIVIAGLLLLVKGPLALRAAWFAVVYLLFLVPLPGVLVDGLTLPLKQLISRYVVDLLYLSGYPIAREGAMITIGQYQLLVADACSGLNSMFSLAALGTLFMYLMARPGRAHNTLMLLAIVPIAFLANLARVVALVLITYHFGDEAGQGFLHGAAGIFLMLVALCAFFAFDAVLAGASRWASRRPAQAKQLATQ